MSPHPSVFISTGEPSGDLLGARLVQALWTQAPHLRIRGISGEMMTQAGVPSIFPQKDLAVMGIVEVFGSLPRILRRLHQAADYICDMRPDVLVTIDAPGFNYRLAKLVRKRLGHTIKLIHYVAPSVWAWRPGRAKKTAALFDHLFCLLPFEPPYFTTHDLATTFIGHPIVELDLHPLPKAKLHDPVNVCFLPGSRGSEVTRLLPIFAEAIQRLSQDHALSLTIPTFPHFRDMIQQALTPLGLPMHFIFDAAEKYQRLPYMDVAIAASGTVSLELAAAGVPFVTTYRLNPISYCLAKHLVKTPYACLINILLNQPIVPELLQHDCTPDRIATEAHALLISKNMRDLQKKSFTNAIKLLSCDDALKPSQKAADIILKYL